MKLRNPLYIAVRNFFGANISFSRLERQVDENFAALRTFINNYVQMRKTGQNQSEINGQADLLTIFLQTPEIFGDHEITDEIIDFFLAGTATTNNSVQTVIGHFATASESLQKVREEFDTLTIENGIKRQDFSRFKDFMKEAVSYETAQSMSYLNMVFQEALRIEPPVPNSSLQSLSQDCKIGKYNLKAGDRI